MFLSVHPIDNKSALDQVMTCRPRGDKPLPEWWPSSMTHICVTWPQWVMEDKTPVYPLTHWGRVTHICVGKLTIIGSENGLSPGRRQAIIWSNAGILLIEPLGTNFSEILVGIQIFSLKKMRLKMSSAKWCPFCLGPNVLSQYSNSWCPGDARCQDISSHCIHQFSWNISVLSSTRNNNSIS